MKTQKPTKKLVPWCSFTHTTPSHSRIEVEEWWDATKVTIEQVTAQWYAEYDPRGYFTQVEKIGNTYQVATRWILVTKMTRSASCD
ncbi:MAG: hypothetical protein A3G11_00420 [Candidatus Lloydbacteria bacterium RIFCSPLOWO2_12_FULL_51_9]|uniref:Uncharacterized protein n=2 Tax=Candidatus Lloydiibacteriota TaxID=1817910 RepID=A0A1G2DSY9_9BACT|nr:MAG: hypothetical protein A3J08_00025 [Candidatus Lloydbacteria bacterium RIFCSPLOWO2_02_FULL_51_11]OGZ16774.1 MAG: hypothetical protein A3G11_00420 [Candidatus Lloydbacteria bacterium RIFCSPLOWO2_12_FULL_51_9]